MASRRFRPTRARARRARDDAPAPRSSRDCDRRTRRVVGACALPIALVSRRGRILAVGSRWPPSAGPVGGVLAVGDADDELARYLAGTTPWTLPGHAPSGERRVDLEAQPIRTAPRPAPLRWIVTRRSAGDPIDRWWVVAALQLTHAVRNALQPLQNVESLVDELGLDRPSPGLDAWLDVTSQSVDRIARLTGAYNRRWRQNLALDDRLRTGDLAGPLRRIVSHFRDLCHDRIQLRETLESTLGPVSHSPDLFEAAMVEVLSNAAQAVITGGEIRVEARIRDDHVVIRVSDDGGGMDEAERLGSRQLFMSTRRDGSGLGLPLADHWLGRMGATLSVTSRKGDGTAISIHLPLQDA